MLIIVQMLMFPEGTTTSGRALIKFKAGESSAWEWPDMHWLPQQSTLLEWLLSDLKGVIGYRFLLSGAFLAGVPVQPVVLRYPNELVSEARTCWEHGWYEAQRVHGLNGSRGMAYNHAIFVCKCSCSCHILFCHSFIVHDRLIITPHYHASLPKTDRSFHILGYLHVRSLITVAT